MGYILVLLVSVSLAGTSLDEREKSNKKFRKEFKFKFQDTVESLATDLKENWDTMTKTDRSEAFDYE